MSLDFSICGGGCYIPCFWGNEHFLTASEIPVPTKKLSFCTEAAQMLLHLPLSWHQRWKCSAPAPGVFAQPVQQQGLSRSVQICASKQEVTAVSQQPWLPPHPAQAFFLLLCWQSRLTPCMWLPLPTTGFWSCTTDTTDCMGKFVTLQGKSPSKHFPFSPSSPPQHTSAPTHQRCWKLSSALLAPGSHSGNVQGDILQNQKAKGCPLRFVIGKRNMS